MAENPTMDEQVTEITENDLPKNLRDLVQKAKGAVEMKNYKYTTSLLQAVLREAPGYVEGRKLLRSSEAAVSGGKKKGLFGSSGGLGLMKIAGQAKKDPLGALDAIEKELEKDPYNPAANELLYETALRLNFLDTAAFALETIRSGAPENTKLLHKLAEFYMTREMPEKAAAVYHDIAKADPSDTDAVKREKDATARASMMKQRTETGEYVLGKKDEDETLAIEKSARAALTKDQLEAKAANLAAEYEQDPNNLAVVKDLALTYENLEDWGNAHTFFDWAHQLSNGDVALKNKAAFMKDKAAEYEAEGRSRRRVERRIRTMSKPATQPRRASEPHASPSRSKSARKRVEQNPTDPQLRYDLGQALYHAK